MSATTDPATKGERAALQALFDELPTGRVDEREAGTLSPAELARYVVRNRPLILKGAVKHWRAHRMLAEDFRSLASMLGDVRLIVRTADELAPEGAGNERIVDGMPDSGARIVSVGEALELLQHAPHAVCVDSTPIFETPAQIERMEQRRARVLQSGKVKRIDGDERAALHLSALLPYLGNYTAMPSPPAPKIYSRWRSFIYKRSYTPFHDHPTDETFMTQVWGRKRTLVVHPRLTPWVEQRLRGDRVVPRPSLGTEPVAFIADVDSGDALYIPIHWGHAVECVEDTPGLTIAYTFGSPLWKHGKLSSERNRELWRRAVDKPLENLPLIALLGVGAIAYAARRLLPSTREAQL